MTITGGILRQVRQMAGRVRNALYTPAYPRTVLLGLHNKCNLLCVFCHREQDITKMHQKYEIPLSQIQQMEWLPNIRTIDLSSGAIEPLMHTQILDILKYLSSLGLRISMTTNGLLLNEKIIHTMLDANVITKVSVNFGRAETYERMMKNARWNTLREKLKLLQTIQKSRGKALDLRLGFVVMKSNYTEINDFLDLAAEHEMFRVYLDQVKVYHNSQISPDESMYRMRDTWDALVPGILEHARKRGVTILSNIARFQTLDSSADNFEGFLKGRSKSYCGESYSTLTIQKVLDDSPDFAVAVCGNQLVQPLYVRSEDILTDKQFRSLWQDSVLRSIRQTCNQSEPNPLCSACKQNDKRLTMSNAAFFQTYSTPEIVEFLSQSPRSTRTKPN